MWPKALAQLIELAPHIARLLPMADRFFTSKTADADASRTAMQQMAEGLRGDLGQVTASHAGLYRQLNDHGLQLSELGAGLRSTKTSVDGIEDRTAHLEQQISRLTILVGIGLLLLATVCILSIVILLHRH
jgi:septal ring factor EnvC (AmiA/AmiB activator)